VLWQPNGRHHAWVNNAIVALYDAHPVTAAVILGELGSRESLAPPDLFPLDQDHYGGPAATEALGLAVELTPADQVLDLCSGIGGPARYVAWRFGCTVTGIELVPSRVADARRLTDVVGLTSSVSFVEGDVTALPFGDGSFDVCLSQESFLHVADKAAVFAECRRVLRPAGRIGFSDWVARPELSSAEHDRLAEAFSAAGIVDQERYLAELADAGFAVTEVEDLTERWRPALRERLEALRGRRERTAARLGEAHAAWWEQEYAFMVGLVHEGKLGGARFVARAG
jgi:sarcosine/dimethylglycine N-methyltransferase